MQWKQWGWRNNFFNFKINFLWVYNDPLYQICNFVQVMLTKNTFIFLTMHPISYLQPFWDFTFDKPPPKQSNLLQILHYILFACVILKLSNQKKMCTFSSRAARFARKFERAWGAQFDRRASRSVLSGPRASRSVFCSSHTFKFISYNSILKLKPIL